MLLRLGHLRALAGRLGAPHRQRAVARADLRGAGLPHRGLRPGPAAPRDPAGRPGHARGGAARLLDDGRRAHVRARRGDRRAAARRGRAARARDARAPASARARRGPGARRARHPDHRAARRDDRLVEPGGGHRRQLAPRHDGRPAPRGRRVPRLGAGDGAGCPGREDGLRRPGAGSRGGAGAAGRLAGRDAAVQRADPHPRLAPEPLRAPPQPDRAGVHHRSLPDGAAGAAPRGSGRDRRPPPAALGRRDPVRGLPDRARLDPIPRSDAGHARRARGRPVRGARLAAAAAAALRRDRGRARGPRGRRLRIPARGRAARGARRQDAVAIGDRPALPPVALGLGGHRRASLAGPRPLAVLRPRALRRAVLLRRERAGRAPAQPVPRGRGERRAAGPDHPAGPAGLPARARPAPGARGRTGSRAPPDGGALRRPDRRDRGQHGRPGAGRRVADAALRVGGTRPLRRRWAPARSRARAGLDGRVPGGLGRARAALGAAAGEPAGPRLGGDPAGLDRGARL